MTASILAEMKGYIGFTEMDAAHLRELQPIVAPHLFAVVDRFYFEVMRHPDARAVLTGGDVQMGRLRGHLHEWLRTLFCGHYDEAYAFQRTAIGHVHVRVGLSQHYMFAGMEILRQELQRIILAAPLENAHARLHSLNKLLSLETAMMLESYKASYSEHVRRLEHMAMEERVTRAERLAEIGQMAASLAHEIKNPLAGISGAIQIIREDLPNEDPHRRVLDEVLRQINRLDGTVKDLLAYARPQIPRLKLCRPGAVVERVTGLMRAEPAFASVALTCEVALDLPAVEVDEHQLEQLLVNLLLNAAHASPPGSAVELRVAADAEEIAFTVADNGEGMDPDTLLRATEPFFTTKARGTGLGLPICMRIVDAHNGALRLISDPGRGTTVEVRMPLCQSADNAGAR